MRLKTQSGKVVSSHSSACGASSLRAKFRIDSRSCSWSSLKMKWRLFEPKSGLRTVSVDMGRHSTAPRHRSKQWYCLLSASAMSEVHRPEGCAVALEAAARVAGPCVAEAAAHD